MPGPIRAGQVLPVYGPALPHGAAPMVPLPRLTAVSCAGLHAGVCECLPDLVIQPLHQAMYMGQVPTTQHEVFSVQLQGRLAKATHCCLTARLHCEMSSGCLHVAGRCLQLAEQENVQPPALVHVALRSQG